MKEIDEKLKPTMCKSKDSVGDPRCSCTYGKIGWDNIYKDPPDPLMTGLNDLSLAYQRKRIYFWVPELMYNKYTSYFIYSFLPHMFCINCGDVKGNVILKGWNSCVRLPIILGSQAC